MNEKTEKFYKIPFRETVYGYIKIIANSKEEALKLLYDGDFSDCEEIDREDFEHFDEDIEEIEID